MGGKRGGHFWTFSVRFPTRHKMLCSKLAQDYARPPIAAALRARADAQRRPMRRCGRGGAPTHPGGGGGRHPGLCLFTDTDMNIQDIQDEQDEPGGGRKGGTNGRTADGCGRIQIGRAHV